MPIVIDFQPTMGETKRHGGAVRVRAIGLTIVVVLSVFAGGVALVGSAGAQDGGPTEIDSCTVIDEPGGYVLTADLRDRPRNVCIEIRASDVVLAGNGHAVDGVQNERSIVARAQEPFEPRDVGIGIGLGTEPLSNVTVMDVTVTDSFTGVFAANASDVVVRNVTASNDGVGIGFDNVSDSLVTDGSASENVLLGVLVDSLGGRIVANNSVTDTTASENGVAGIGVFNSTDGTFAGNVVEGNDLFGLFAAASVDRSAITDTRAANNAIGIEVIDGTNVRVTDNDVIDNSYVGLELIGVRSGLVSGNRISGTEGISPFPEQSPAAGLYVEGSSEIAVVGNEVAGNDVTGVTLVGSSNALLVANEANANAEDGFGIVVSANVLLTLNTATGNADDGIGVLDSRRVAIAGNTLAGNGDRAVEVTNSENVVQSAVERPPTARIPWLSAKMTAARN